MRIKMTSSPRGICASSYQKHSTCVPCNAEVISVQLLHQGAKHVRHAQRSLLQPGIVARPLGLIVQRGVGAHLQYAASVPIGQLHPIQLGIQGRVDRHLVHLQLLEHRLGIVVIDINFYAHATLP